MCKFFARYFRAFLYRISIYWEKNRQFCRYFIDRYILRSSTSCYKTLPFPDEISIFAWISYFKNSKFITTRIALLWLFFLDYKYTYMLIFIIKFKCSNNLHINLVSFLFGYRFDIPREWFFLEAYWHLCW